MIRPYQRVVIGLLDGMGLDYAAAQPLPAMERMAAQGLYLQVDALMPSVTNVNNASVCCGVYADAHGITGNSYLDERTGQADFMESSVCLRAPTVIQRAADFGIPGALLTCKRKTLSLLGAGAAVTLAAEDISADAMRRYGQAPGIYSREINYWLWEVAIDLLATRPDLGVLYVHTTDYPMHEWPAEAAESREHMTRLDALIGAATEASPDAAFLLTADHGMNAKTRCWDLTKACASRGAPLRLTLSVERDRYLRHHRGFGGTAWVWLRRPEHAEAVANVLRSLEGVEEVLTRQEAAACFHLMPERIGELVVLGDRETVFGELDREIETLGPRYRSHGSRHELRVPLIAFGAEHHELAPDTIRHNADLTRGLYR